MPDLLGVTLDDMIWEVRRELEQRGRLYPQLGSTGRANKHRLQRQLEVMQAVLEHLEAEHGPGATVHLLQSYLAAPPGTEMISGVGQDPRDGAPFVVVHIVIAGSEPVGLSPVEARGVAEFCARCMDTGCPKDFTPLVHRLTELADEADAARRERLH
jgi:hypothetical protein